jgi:DNA repair exonuclease SbcCD ATPase subunit
LWPADAIFPEDTMNMRVIAALLAVGLAASPAFAAENTNPPAAAPEQAAPATPKQTAPVQPLTAERAKAFVEAMEEIHPKVTAFRAAQAKAGKKADEAQLKAEEAELLAIVQKHGFDKESWNATGDRVVSAYSFTRMEQEGKNVEEKISAAEQRAQQDSKMTDQQKADLLAALEQTREQYHVAALDKPVVIPLMDRLKKVLEE